MLIALCLTPNKANAVAIPAGTYTIGSGGSYATITAAAAALNTNGIAGSVIFELKTTYTSGSETYPITFNAGIGSAGNTITFRPASGATGLSITGSNATSLIEFNGTDYITFDGQPAGAGGVSQLTIENTNTTSGAMTIYMHADAKHVTVTYCTVKGTNTSTTDATRGVINMGGTTVSGNDYNVISYCNITKSSTNKPACAIGMQGDMSYVTDHVTISNNNIYDFTQYGIYTSTAAQTWTITNNSFYQSSSFALTTNMFAINLDGAGDGSNNTGHTITGNYIGGQSASCGGSAFTLSSSAFKFTGIYIDSYGSGTNTISANTMQNFNITYTSTGVAFTGVYTTYLGTNSTFVIGSSGNGNIIGSTTGTGSIVITLNTGTASTGFIAFDLGATDATHTLAYNTVGGLSISSTAVSSYGRGSPKLVDVNSNGAITINNNTFGNATAQNISYSANADALYGFYGLYLSGAGSNTPSVHDNTFQNFYSNCNMDIVVVFSTNSSVNGMSFYNNTLSTMTTQAGRIDGLYLTYPNTGTFNLYSNNISSFSCSGDLYGFYMDGISGSPTINLYKNKITACGSSGDETKYNVGIEVSQTSATSTVNIYNNIIITDDGGASVAKVLRGIIDYTAGTSYIYYNTVKFNATYSSGIGISACYTCSYAGGTHYVKNNIWQNLITGGSGDYVAQKYNSTPTKANIGYNYNEAPSAAKYCYWNNLGVSWTNWSSGAAPGISNERNGTITLDANGQATASTTIGSAGTSVSIGTDYLGASRHVATPWIGAYEGAAVVVADYYWVGGTGNWDAYATHWATASGGASFHTSAPTSTDNVYFNASSGGGTVTLNVAASAAVVTFTNFTGSFAGASALSATTLSVTAGTYAMGVTTANFSGNATIASTVTISTGTLDVDGTFNATGGAITFSGAGNLALGGATVTSLGTLSATAGTVKYNRAGAQTVLSDNYFNLTIDGSGTKTLGGAIDVDGSINITAGTLDVSASNYAITCAGNWTNGATFVPQAGTVTFDGSGAQTVTTGGTAAGKEFYNVTINNSAGSPGDAADVDASDIYITHNLVITDGQYQPATNSFIGAVEIQTNGILKPDASATITVTGAWLNTNGTFTHNNCSTIFDYTGTITTGGTGTGKKFYDVTLNGTQATLGGNIDIDRHLKLSMGTWNTSGSNYSMNIGGDFVIDNTALTTFNANSSTVTFDGSATQYINVTAVGGTTPVDETITFYDIVIDNTDVRFYYNKTNDRYFNMRNMTINNGKTVKLLSI